MKNTELRIGNYIQDISHPERKCQVSRLTSGIDFNITYVYSKAYECSYANDHTNYLQPIELTEEWLLKFGFKKCKVRKLYDNSFIMKNVLKSDLYLRPAYQGGYYWGFITPESIIGSELEHEFYHARPVQFVHELQNLYFALTGTELQLKER